MRAGGRTGPDRDDRDIRDGEKKREGARAETSKS